MRICFATNNADKIREAQSLLGDDFQLITLLQLGCTEELHEDGRTFEDNSRQKAEYIFERFRLPCFADDSGLTVHALHGAPGVDSAFYAGPQRSSLDNIALLLKNLEGVSDRAAQFETVITYVAPGIIRSFKGIATGRISERASGTGGFGYDPVFVPDGYDITFAEMSREEKNKISHRGAALRDLVEFLKLQGGYQT